MWVRYADTSDYTNHDLYITLHIKGEEENICDCLSQMLRSQDVFKSVSGVTKDQPRHKKRGNKWGQKRLSDKKYAEYEFYINLSDDTTPKTFHQEYPAKQNTEFADLNGFGNVTISQLQEAGYDYPAEVNQEDLIQLHKKDILSQRQAKKIANAFNLTAPSNTKELPDVDLDDGIEVGDIFTLAGDCRPLTSLKVEKLVKAGYTTVESVKNASNEALLEVHGIGNRTVYKIRDEFLPDDVRPDISPY